MMSFVAIWGIVGLFFIICVTVASTLACIKSEDHYIECSVLVPVFFILMSGPLVWLALLLWYIKGRIWDKKIKAHHWKEKEE
jgi:hypothetical protein